MQTTQKMTQTPGFTAITPDALQDEINHLIEQGEEEQRRKENERIALAVLDRIKIVREANQCRITANTPRIEAVPVLSWYGNMLLTQGGISVIGGAAKSRKSFFITSIITAVLTGKFAHLTGIEGKPCDRPILHFDTEQAGHMVQKVFDRIQRMTLEVEGATINADDLENKYYLYAVQEKSIETKKKYITSLVEEYRPCMVIVDVGTDLMNDPNDLRESGEFMQWLLTMAKVSDCHICLVAHTNPGTDIQKIRGHFGSDIERKCETAIIVEPKGEYSRASIKAVRHLAPERGEVYFEIVNGLISMTEIENLIDPKKEQKASELRELFYGIFGNRPIMTHSELCRKVEDIEEISERTARRRIVEAAEIGILEKLDNGGYRVIAQIPANGYDEILSDDDAPF